MAQRPRGRRQAEVRRLRPAFLGIGLFACLGFLNLFVGGVVGTTGVLVLAAVWLLLLLIAATQFTRRPMLVLGLGVLDLAVWAVVVFALR